MRCWLIALFAFALPALAFAGAAEGPRAFWVRDLSAGPARYRAVTATLRASGERVDLYQEDGVRVSDAYGKKLIHQLESEAPAGALLPKLGALNLLEKLFGALPATGGGRLEILFAKLGGGAASFVSPFDGWDHARAEAAGERSNEANVVYVNGPRGSDDQTTAAIARGIEEILLRGLNDTAPSTDPWLAETLRQSAVLAAGLPPDPVEVRRFAARPEAAPLVTEGEAAVGPQILFASYLLDQLGERADALGRLGRIPGPGRGAVEAFFREETGMPLTFDLVFGNFLAYLATATSGHTPDLDASPTRTLRLPPFATYLKLETLPALATGSLLPYSFAVIDLPNELPATALVDVVPLPRGARRPDGSLPCSETASLLWKPLSPQRLAVYAVGCEHQSELDRVYFSLSVLDKPFLEGPRPHRR